MNTYTIIIIIWVVSGILMLFFMTLSKNRDMHILCIKPRALRIWCMLYITPLVIVIESVICVTGIVAGWLKDGWNGEIK